MAEELQVREVEKLIEERSVHIDSCNVFQSLEMPSPYVKEELMQKTKN
jgi:hypothetical protein